MVQARAVFGLLLLAALAGCSTARPWTNAALDHAPTPGAVAAVAARDPSTLVAVTLSGGGARAAAFGYGVLQELRATPCCGNERGSNMLEAVDVVSGVSGGSIIAAYFAAFGGQGLDNFERDFLRQNFQQGLLSQLLRPGNLWDLGSPWIGRSQLLARQLDTLYQGMTFGDIERRPRHPQLLVTATDMSLGTGFEFTADQFELICSDIGSVPLSFAVAASSAVPILLSPMTLKNHSETCRERGIVPQLVAPATHGNYRARMLRVQENSYLDGRARPFIHLVDGGLADNLGVRRLLDRAVAGGLRASFSEVALAPGSIHRLVLIMVNAARDPSAQVDASDRVPSVPDVADTLLISAGARAARETQEFLADTAWQWRENLRQRSADGADVFAPDARIHVVKINLHDAAEGPGRRSLLHIPTAFSVGDAEVTSLIEAGRSVLRESPDFLELLRSLGVAQQP
ncbi:patatin-like phospholipase family protein [uncultured Ramlibacter sp.]|uniref:patatin-like phospholipase family protein n=1 Tax=uncultured Ramlibacter sp. TaxID=260755 RepID=UPI00262FED19|nr:patatin-like phospholipase family protein [uncultured Ramlibacter sp.]